MESKLSDTSLPLFMSVVSDTLPNWSSVLSNGDFTAAQLQSQDSTSVPPFLPPPVTSIFYPKNNSVTATPVPVQTPPAMQTPVPQPMPGFIFPFPQFPPTTHHCYAHSVPTLPTVPPLPSLSSPSTSGASTPTAPSTPTATTASIYPRQSQRNPLLASATDEEIRLLKELSDIGFGAIPRNLTLLRRHRNNLDDVVNALIDEDAN